MQLLKISSILAAVPSLRPLLSPKARYLLAIETPADLKSADDFAARLTQLVKSLYKGTIGGDFIDALGALIARQITLAYRAAWGDEGDEGDMPKYLADAAEDAIVGQFEFVDGYYKDIVDAREDKTPIDALLSRVDGWAHQYDVAYKDAVQMIRLENGGNLRWTKGATEHGCDTCAALDGIVLSATEWEALDVHPRGYPNKKLKCEGGGPVNYCDCELEQTDSRRSPRGFETVLNIVGQV